MSEYTFNQWVEDLKQAYETHEKKLGHTDKDWHSWLCEYIAGDEVIFKYILDAYAEDQRGQQQFEEMRGGI